jgi:hypothetical protein
MTSLASLSFVTPWLLAAAVFLPLLWWLLRLLPPTPRRQRFPALRLLFGLEARRDTSARTPLWLVALRLLLAAIVIIGAAQPLEHATAVRFGGPLLLVVDNGWAAARHWEQRERTIGLLLDQADRNRRPVILLSTAPPADGARIATTGLISANAAKSIAAALRPLPWPTDRIAARAALDTLPKNQSMQVIWIADGLANDDQFSRRLSDVGDLTIASPSASDLPKLLLPPAASTGGQFEPIAVRAASGISESISVAAVDASGHTLDRTVAQIAAGDTRQSIQFDMPVELRNRVARFDIEGQSDAGSVALLDSRWHRHPVGLVGTAGEQSTPLLDDLYYSGRALEPIAEVRRGSVQDLLKRDLAMIVLPDQGSLSGDDQTALRAWIERGGVLLRLAGPKLAANPDELLPVQLLGEGRTLGGAMSWTQPMALAPLPKSGPFAGLDVPSDLRVNAQVLAEPAPDLDSKSWARLTDGTPLVTGAPMGKGWLVLLHTTAWPGWSNLGLSGLFPAMLARLLDLSQGVPGTSSDRPLPALQMLDGFGRLGAASGIAEALSPEQISSNTLPPGPRHPPGLYGDAAGVLAVNLAPAIGPIVPMVLPDGAHRMPLDGFQAARDLRPLLLTAALLLLLLDGIVSIALGSGLIRKLRPATLVLIGLVAMVRPAAADDRTLQAELQTRLAYVVTHDAQVDSISRAGLDGLTNKLAQRTTAVLGSPIAVEIGRDPLAVYPLLYWPITPEQGPLPPVSRDAINDYMRHGGMILFDTRDGGDAGARAFRAVGQGLDIPPLQTVTQDHVLTHTYYLLRDLPGRSVGPPVYVRRGSDPANDDVSPVVIGANDWAGAWAIDRTGAPLLDVNPGGEIQRERAYRFGINLVMYALTGSYKSDQVHIPTILERLGR